MTILRTLCIFTLTPLCNPNECFCISLWSKEVSELYQAPSWNQMYFWIWSWDFSFCSPRCREYGNLCAMYWACQRERSLSCGYSALVYHGRCEVHCINATIHVVVVDNRLQFCSLIFWHSHFILHGWKQKNHPGFHLCITFLVRIGNKHFFCQYSTTLLTWAFFLLTVSFQGGSLCDQREWCQLL